MTFSHPTDEDSLFDIDDPLENEEIAPPTEFAIQMRPALEKILAALVKAELIEFEEDKRELLYSEMTEAAGKARHPKALLKGMLYALIESDNVEEIFGSDSELMHHFKQAVSS